VHPAARIVAMAHHTHHRHAAPAHAAHRPALARRESLTRTAWMATLHCLLGCAIGEVAGLLIGGALGWGNHATVMLAIVLAFVSGFTLTAWPFLRAGWSLRAAVRVALTADAVSIAIMEVVDNLLMWVIPGAMDAPITAPLFWSSMLASLVAAGLAAFPVNRWLIARGRGHAVVHGAHGRSLGHAG
jgi:hypothetical protein